MQLTSVIELSKAGWSPFLVCDYDQAKDFIAKKGSRILMKGPDGKTVHRALQLRKDGYAVIMLSKAILKSWQLEPGMQVRVSISKDDSEFGMAFPEEFQVVLEQDPEADAAFRSRKPGKQRGVLHFIDSGKTEETRIKRALDMAERLKNNALHGEENAPD
jgi:uncharacterized protein YdeI (YjbR/CyaY-like superfamily)